MVKRDAVYDLEGNPTVIHYDELEFLLVRVIFIDSPQVLTVWMELTVLILYVEVAKDLSSGVVLVDIDIQEGILGAVRIRQGDIGRPVVAVVEDHVKGGIAARTAFVGSDELDIKRFPGALRLALFQPTDQSPSHHFHIAR